MAIITLLTDFGVKDHFVASMKGVILGINPEASIIDITHDVPKFDVLRAALILKAAYKWFPRGTIHVVVVDPGVGTSRKPIVIQTKNYFFIGPDNGVLSLAADDDGAIAAREILPNGESSYTFHGRDLFAPTAAKLGRGMSFNEVGPVIVNYNRINLPKPTISGNNIIATAIYIDSFGNVFTNITRNDIDVKYGSRLLVELENGARLTLILEKSYGYAAQGESLAVINSEGYLELAVNRGSFADKYGVSPGQSIRLIITN